MMALGVYIACRVLGVGQASQKDLSLKRSAFQMVVAAAMAALATAGADFAALTVAQCQHQRFDMTIQLSHHYVQQQ
jgi:hypothetical protein